MPLNLKSTGGGSVSLTPAATAVDVNITVPATAGTLVTTGSLGASIVPYVPAGTGAVATNVQAALRNSFISPINFGAVGDGVTDDTAAVRLAIAEGKPINLHGKTFLVKDVAGVSGSSILSVTTPLYIYGEGGGITFSAPANSSNVAGVRVQSSFRADDCIFKFINNTAAQQQGVQRIFALGNTNEVKFDQCTFDGSALVWDARNIYCDAISPDTTAVVGNVHVTNCLFSGLMYGVVSYSTFTGTMNNWNVISGTRFTNITADAVEYNAPLGTMSNMTVDDCYITNYTGSPTAPLAGFGVGIARCTIAKVTNVRVDSTYLEGIHIEDQTTYTLLEGNHTQCKRGIVVYPPVQTIPVSQIYGVVTIANNTVAGVLAVALGSSMASATPAALGSACIGIFLPSYGQFNSAYYVNVVNNTVTQCDIGMTLPASAGSSVSDNNITNCTVGFWSDDPQYNATVRVTNNRLTHCRYAFEGQRLLVGKVYMEDVNNIFLRLGALGSIVLTDGFVISTGVSTVAAGTTVAFDMCETPSNYFDPCATVAIHEVNTSSTSPQWAYYSAFDLLINGATITPTSKYVYGYGAAGLDGTPFSIVSSRLNTRVANSGGSSKDFKVIFASSGSFTYAY